MCTELSLHIVNCCVVFDCGDLHSGGGTRRLHSAALIQKPVADLSDGVGEYHSSETGTFESEPHTYCVQCSVPKVDMLYSFASH